MGSQKGKNSREDSTRKSGREGEEQWEEERYVRGEEGARMGIRGRRMERFRGETEVSWKEENEPYDQYGMCKYGEDERYERYTGYEEWDDPYDRHYSLGKDPFDDSWERRRSIAKDPFDDSWERRRTRNDGYKDEAELDILSERTDEKRFLHHTNQQPH